MDPIILTSGDDKPSLDIQLLDTDGTGLDLSDATTVISAKFRARGTTTVLDTLTCEKITGGGATGWVRINWDTDTLDVDEGWYEIEISISYDGSIQTIINYYQSDETQAVSDVLQIYVREEF